MKKQTLLWLFCLAFLYSCSKSGENKSQRSDVLLPEPETFVEYELKEISTNPEIVNFGTILNNGIKTFSLSISNLASSTESLIGPISVEEGSDFSIVSSNCNNVKPKNKCSVRVSFNANGKSSATYSSNLTIDSFNIPIQVTVEPYIAPELQQNILISQANLNFGTIAPTQSVVKVISFTNQSNVPISFPVVVESPFLKVSDSCTGVSVPVKSNCSIRVALSGRGLEGSSVSGNLFYGDAANPNRISIPLSAQVLSFLENAQLNSNLKINYGSQDYSTTQEMDLGIVSQSQVKTGLFKIKNSGKAATPISEFAFNHPQIVIISNSCPSILGAGKDCTIRFAIRATEQADLSFSVNQTFGTKQFPIKFTYHSNTVCSVANANLGGVTLTGVTGVEGFVPHCFVTACSGVNEVSSDRKECAPPSTALIGTNVSTGTQLGGFFPVLINYKNLVFANNGDYSNVTYSIESSSLSGAGTYACSPNNPTECFFSPTQLGNFFIVIRGTRSSGETATARVDIEVFGGDNVPQFSSPGKIYISLKQGETIDFNLDTASSGSDPIRYEINQHPAVGAVTHCLNLQFADNANNDLSCKYLANGNLFRTSFSYKAVNTVNNKFALKEVEISISDSDNVLDVYPSRWASLAINDAGSVFGRGLMQSGILGIDVDYRPSNFVFENNNVIKTALPDQVSKLWVKSNSAIAKLNNGQYWVWGQNRRSKLGILNYTANGDLIYKPQKSDVLSNSGLDFIHMTINDNSTCGLTNTGRVFCWGSNEYSELATNITTPSYGDVTLREVNFGLRSQVETSVVNWDTNRAGYSFLSNGGASKTSPISDWSMFLKSATNKLTGDFEAIYTLNKEELQHGWFVGVSKTFGLEYGTNLAGFSQDYTNFRVYANSANRNIVTLLDGLNTIKVQRVGSLVKFFLNNVEVDQVAYGTEDVYPVARLNGTLRSASIIGTQTKKASLLADSSVNSNHHCAIVENEALCWGLNSSGQLGFGRTDSELPSSATPLKVKITEGIKKIAIGASFTCAVSNSDRVKCWGKNDQGQLGYGDTTQRGQTEASMSSLPNVDLGNISGSPILSREIYIGAGGDAVCSILMDYRVKCWGRNQFGQLGYGDSLTRGSSSSHMGNTLPFLKDINNIDLVAAFIRTSGEEDFCLRSNTSSKVYCWGNNQYTAIADIFPNVPNIPKEYNILTGDTAPYLASGSSLSRNFTTSVNTSRTLNNISPTFFKDLYTNENEILYFFDDSATINPITGVVYDKNNPSIIAGQLNLACLGGINRNLLNSCTFTPATGYQGEFVLNYKACSSSLKCSNQIIEVVSRVVDPNKPYYVSGTTETILNLNRFESKTFSVPAPQDPQNKPWGFFQRGNNVRPNIASLYEIYDNNGKVAGTLSGCQIYQVEIPHTEIYYYSWPSYQNGNNCVFRPKENFTGEASFNYVAKNSDGFESEIRTITFRVNPYLSNNVLHAIGYTSSFERLTDYLRYPETNTSYRGGMYYVLGGADNTTYSNPYSSVDIYPTPIYKNIVADLSTTKSYGNNNKTTEIISQVHEVVGKKGQLCYIVGHDRKLACMTETNQEYMIAGQLNPSIPGYWSTPELRWPRYISNSNLTDYLTNVYKADIGSRMACAISGSNNQVYCWGKDVKGCGNTFQPGVPCPVINQSDVALTNAKEISVGDYSACAIVDESGSDKLYCWGYKLDANGMGSISRPLIAYTDPNNFDIKAKEISVPNPVKVVVGDSHACSSSSDNRLYCWGHNGSSYQMLGRNLPHNSLYFDPAPVKKNATEDLLVDVKNFDIARLSPYNDYSCAIGLDSEMYCWGYSESPALFPSSTTFPSMVDLSEAFGIKKLVVSERRICLQSLDNRLKCWGNNAYGEIGDKIGDTFGWKTYAQSSNLKIEPNGSDIEAQNFALTTYNLFFVNPTLIENHEYYQTSASTIEIAERSSLNVSLTSSLDPNDEIVIMTKPYYSTLLFNSPTEISITSRYDLTNSYSFIFDFFTFYKKSDPSKVYRYVIKTNPSNNTPVARNFEMSVQHNSSSAFSIGSLGTDSDSPSMFGFELLSSPQYGTISNCINTAGLPIGVRNSCNYTPNLGSGGQIETLSFRLYDNNSYSEIKNIKIFILNSEMALEFNTLNETIPSYSRKSINLPKTYSIYGINSQNQIIPIQGIENDGGIYKIKNANDITIATVRSGCTLSNSPTIVSCIIDPIKGTVDSAVVRFKYRNQYNEESPEVTLNISINQNETDLLYAIGYTHSPFAGHGLYQDRSFLNRLQGNTNPANVNSDPYPIPMSIITFLENPAPLGLYPGYNPVVNPQVLSGFQKIKKSTAINDPKFLTIKNNKVYMFGYPVNWDTFSPWNFSTTSYTGLWEVSDTQENSINDPIDFALGSTQGCIIHGENRKLSCFGRTSFGNISQSNIARSGCGYEDSLTPKGYACSIKKQNGQILENVQKVDTFGNSTCAIVQENDKGQLYCWGFVHYPENNESRSSSTLSHNYNYAFKIADYANDDLIDLGVHDNRTCVSLSDGKISCFGQSSYIPTANPNSWIKRSDFILNANTTGQLILRRTEQDFAIVEFPIPSAENANISIASWNVSNEDETPVIEMSSDRTDSSIPNIVFKSIKVKLNNGKSYSVNLNTDTNSYSGTTSVDKLKQNKLISLPSDVFCGIGESNKFLCWGYDHGQAISDSGSVYFNSNKSNPIERPLISSLVPNTKEFKVNYNNICAITINDEVLCWGRSSYGANGLEQYANSTSSWISPAEAQLLKQKVNGPTVKAKDMLVTDSSLLILSQNPMEINIDPQPLELAVEQNTILTNLIPNVDTNLYEYFIIKKPDYGFLSGDITNLSYTSNQSYYTGQDIFTYRVFDKARNESIVYTVILKVRPRNTAPVAQNVSRATKKSVAGTPQSVGISLSATDVNGNPLSYSIVDQATNGTVSCSSSSCNYTPNQNFVGIDSFTYKANDGQADSNIATATIQVREDFKPFFSQSAYTIQIPKGTRRFNFNLPNAISPNYANDAYYRMVQNSDVIREYNNSVVFKKDGQTVIQTSSDSSCFLNSPDPSYSSSKSCFLDILKDFSGTVSFQVIAKNPSYPEEANDSDPITINLEINNQNKSLYVLGYVTSQYSDSGAGHFEPFSLEYRIRGGNIGNSEVSHLANYEVFPIPFVQPNRNFSNISVMESGFPGICFQDGTPSDVWCIKTSNNYGSMGQVSNFGGGSLEGPSQKILMTNGDSIPTIQKIAVGNAQTCSVTSDNKAICWGSTQSWSVSPTTVDLTGCGFMSSITPSGRACYLVDENNQDFENIIDISVSENKTSPQGCLIKEEVGVGKVYCWGQPLKQNDSIKNIAKEMVEFNTKSASKVSVGDDFACVAYNDNSIKCMGINSNSRLGINISSNSQWYLPQDLNFLDIDGISPVSIKPHTLKAHQYGACVVDVNDRLQCWGHHSYGVYSKASDYPQTSKTLIKPEILLSESISDFTLTVYSICVKTMSNNSSCWGYNPYGELGNTRFLIDNQTASNFNSPSYISVDERMPVKDYLNKSNVIIEKVRLTSGYQYLLVNSQNTFEVPLFDYEKTFANVLENSAFNFSLGDINNKYYIFDRSDYGKITGTSPQNLNYNVSNESVANNSFFDFITYLVRDISGKNTVKMYIFKVEKQNDAPVYVNRDFIVASGQTISFSHSSNDPDTSSGSITYSISQNVSQGSLTCSGTSCSFVAPTLSPGSPDLNLTALISVSDGQVNSATLGQVSFKVKSASNPYFENNSISYSMIQKEPSLTMKIPKAIDPRNNINQITYSPNNSSIRTVIHPTLGTQVSMIFDKLNSELAAGYISNCSLAAGYSPANNIDNCVFNVLPNYLGTARFEYLASNGSEASNVVSVEIAVNPISSISNYIMVSGYGDINYSGGLKPYSTSVNEWSKIDYFMYPYQNEEVLLSNTVVNERIIRDVESISYNSRKNSWCITKKSEKNSMTKKTECFNVSGYDHFGTRPGPYFYHPNTWYNNRFVGLTNLDGSDFQYDILKTEIGRTQTCSVLNTDKSLRCWGDHNGSNISLSTVRRSGCGFNQTLIEPYMPCDIVDESQQELINVIDVSLGANDKCAIIDNNGIGSLACWGVRNYSLGTPLETFLPIWQRELNEATILPGSESMNIRNVEAGESFACVEKTDNTVACWGQNRQGQLARGDTESSWSSYLGERMYPIANVDILDQGVSVSIKPNTLQVENTTACVVGSDHQIYCWGQQLFTGMYSNVSTSYLPRKIEGFSESFNFKQVRLGSDSLCGILLSNEVVCLGSNYYRKVSHIAQDNITPALATKVLDPRNGLPLTVKDVALPQGNNIIFLKE